MKHILLAFAAIALLGCNGDPQKNTESTKNCGEWLDNSHASLFAIRVCSSDTTLFLLNPADGGDTLAEFPLENGRHPERIATISTTHVPMLSALNTLDYLVGVGYSDYITDTDVRQRLEEGSIRAITSDDNINYEVVVDILPEALLVYPYGNENYDRYEEAGISVLPISEYAEKHPLGRAEWIKVMGLLTGQFSQANAIFNETAKTYEDWKRQAETVENRPLVFTGSFYKGRWSAPGGESFIAQFIEDAGARYAFEEYPGHENNELDFEVVLEKIAEADFFGKVIYREDSVSRMDFMEENERFELLQSFNDDQLFYCNTNATDYFGKGLLDPHLMLRDLFTIFHPEQADTARFAYFKPLSH